ncbi:MAG: hypothetical protein UR66_C0003G0008 [Candidatus Moranbacteria bacterium GW2011_GWE1_35_17]|nr:MAG: hypothetical protein UR66_C0003G0008 [Candidatus Moranbacteria bacterium GW2011_GWE1_35_17]KKP82934.1 MAG: hypothetical protein UR82_C0027G0008 [Candidatus Moranbacteria bacterium GW2011_GWF1_35_5]KKP83303.1 MAG: hypothetical protein UR83_C0037G0008 [Candidatus Moranbacteria bacterium GW2011_GWF2_35_54]
MNKIAERVGIIFLVASVFTMSACMKAQVDDGAKPGPPLTDEGKPQKSVSESVPPRGSFAPGFFVKNTVRKLKSALEDMNESGEKAKNIEQVPATVEEDVILAEEKPDGAVIKSRPSNGVVIIKAGPRKIMYAVVEKSDTNLKKRR